MNDDGFFVYLVLSYQRRTAQIGNYTENSSAILQNGIVPSHAQTLTECYIPKEINGYKIIQLGYRALAGYPALKIIYVPNTLEYCAGDAFAYNPLLEEVIFEDNSQLKSLGFYAFFKCEKIKTIVIPKSVVRINGYSFGEMSSLERIYIQNLFVPHQNVSKSIFSNTNTENLQIFVPKNYLQSEFAGVPVHKNLSAFYLPHQLTCYRKLPRLLDGIFSFLILLN